jgi:hypothetical protein
MFWKNTEQIKTFQIAYEIIIQENQYALTSLASTYGYSNQIRFAVVTLQSIGKMVLKPWITWLDGRLQCGWL